MNSRRCNLRTTSGKTLSTPEGLPWQGSALPGPTGFSRQSGFRRLHLRLLTVSRFAGLLPSLDLAYQLRRDGPRKSGDTQSHNFYVAPERTLGVDTCYRTNDIGTL
jgi:hypothetical protein